MQDAGKDAGVYLGRAKLLLCSCVVDNFIKRNVYIKMKTGYD